MRLANGAGRHGPHDGGNHLSLCGSEIVMRNRILGFVSILILILVGAVSQAQEPRISASVMSVEVKPGGYLVVNARQGYEGQAGTSVFTLRFALSQDQIEVLRTGQGVSRYELSTDGFGRGRYFGHDHKLRWNEA